MQPAKPQATKEANDMWGFDAFESIGTPAAKPVSKPALSRPAQPPQAAQPAGGDLLDEFFGPTDSAKDAAPAADDDFLGELGKPVQAAAKPSNPCLLYTSDAADE